jgi:hypothetical protein
MRSTLAGAEAAERENERISEALQKTWKELNDADAASSKKQEQTAKELADYKAGQAQRDLDALGVKGDAIKRESGLAEDQIQQKAISHSISQLAAQQQLDAARTGEIAQLTALAAEYEKMGAAGRDAYAEIEGEITRTMEATAKQDKKSPGAEAAKTLGDGMTSMAEKIASATGKGRESFRKMATGIEGDLVELAVKFAMQKWMTPWLNGLAGGGGGGGVDPTAASDLSSIRGYAAGGDPTGPSVVGEDGPELFFPKGPGTVMPNDALQNLSRTSGGGGAPNMTMNVTNASSQPVTARQTSSSFDADTRSYMTHVILEDLSQNGPISAAMRTGS